MQFFYINGIQEEYIYYKDREFRHLLGSYAFDGGLAQFCVADFDNNGEYELYCIFHAGSGMDYRFLDVFIPEREVAITGFFVSVNNGFTMIKKDNHNLSLVFNSGETATVALVKEDDAGYSVFVDLPHTSQEAFENSNDGLSLSTIEIK